MINLDPIITQAQIASLLGIIAIAVVYYVFAKKPVKSRKS